MPATTGQLGLVTPTQGDLSGTWGNTVNNGITEYTNIAIAGTLTLSGDGAVTLENTTGNASATNITASSTLSGAGTATAQFALVKVTGTLTATKVVTFGSAGAPPYSKTYTVVNAATGGSVSFTAYGGTGVTIAVGESAFVYYNGTNIVKVSTTVASGVTSFTAGTTGFTPSTATTGAVTLAGTLGTANGGTNLGGATPFTSGGVVYASSTSALATGSALTFDGTALTSLNNSNAQSIILSRTSATARNWALGVDGDGGFRLTDATGSAVILSSLPSALTTLNSVSELVFKASNTEGMRLTSTGLGIGTSSPSSKLHVSTTDAAGAVTVTATTATNASYQIFTNTGSLLVGRDNSTGSVFAGAPYASVLYSQGAYPLIFFTNSTEKTRISSAGGFSVGTTADPGAGAIYATGNITAYYSSDIKFKENVRDIPDALATVNAIGGKLFDWKDDYIESKGGADGYFVQKADFGVVAQDVQKVFPIAVRTREDGSLAVDYEKLGALAFAAVGELTALVQTLATRVEALESK